MDDIIATQEYRAWLEMGKPEFRYSMTPRKQVIDYDTGVSSYEYLPTVYFETKLLAEHEAAAAAALNGLDWTYQLRKERVSLNSFIDGEGIRIVDIETKDVAFCEAYRSSPFAITGQNTVTIDGDDEWEASF